MSKYNFRTVDDSYIMRRTNKMKDNFRIIDDKLYSFDNDGINVFDFESW